MRARSPSRQQATALDKEQCSETESEVSGLVWEGVFPDKCLGMVERCDFRHYIRRFSFKFHAAPRAYFSVVLKYGSYFQKHDVRLGIVLVID